LGTGRLVTLSDPLTPCGDHCSTIPCSRQSIILAIQRDWREVASFRLPVIGYRLSGYGMNHRAVRPPTTDTQFTNRGIPKRAAPPLASVYMCGIISAGQGGDHRAGHKVFGGSRRRHPRRLLTHRSLPGLLVWQEEPPHHCFPAVRQSQGGISPLPVPYVPGAAAFPARPHWQACSASLKPS
jgi:hypothetical protein